jgi:hypothetical protein
MIIDLLAIPVLIALVFPFAWLTRRACHARMP